MTIIKIMMIPVAVANTFWKNPQFIDQPLSAPIDAKIQRAFLGSWDTLMARLDVGCCLRETNTANRGPWKKEIPIGKHHFFGGAMLVLGSVNYINVTGGHEIVGGSNIFKSFHIRNATQKSWNMNNPNSKRLYFRQITQHDHSQAASSDALNMGNDPWVRTSLGNLVWSWSNLLTSWWVLLMKEIRKKYTKDATKKNTKVRKNE